MQRNRRHLAHSNFECWCYGLAVMMQTSAVVGSSFFAFPALALALDSLLGTNSRREKEERTVSRLRLRLRKEAVKSQALFYRRAGSVCCCCWCWYSKLWTHHCFTVSLSLSLSVSSALTFAVINTVSSSSGSQNAFGNAQSLVIVSAVKKWQMAKWWCK